MWGVAGYVSWFVGGNGSGEEKKKKKKKIN